MMGEPVERVADADDVIGENEGTPEVYRRHRHGRSYFTPPASWGGQRAPARERIRRGRGRW
jgi:hypothetical protein